jgi:hypothetical protein
MDRFSATLLVRRTLRRRDSRRHAILVEAIMEELAPRASESPECWAVMGLLSQLDLEYSETNPLARGHTSRQQAVLEGVPPELARSLEQWCRVAAPMSEKGPETRPLVEDALFLADFLAHGLLARPEAHSSARQSQAAPAQERGLIEGLGRELALRRQSGDGRGDRLDAALERLGMDGLRAARATVVAMKRVAQDLR